MLLVKDITHNHADGGTVETAIAPDSMFVDSNGFVSPLIYVEILAQAFAALDGYTSHLEGKASGKGFLVGLKSCVFHDAPPVPAGAQMVATLDVEGRADAFTLVRGELTYEGELIMSGILKLYQPEQD